MLLFFDSDACVEQECIRESPHIRRGYRESEQSARTDFSQNSRPYIILKLPCDPHATLIFYWSRLTPMH